jgi:hypothetical protein
MAKYNLLSLLVALAAAFSSVSLAFIPPPNKRPIPSSPLAMSSSSSSTTSNRRPKRTVNDRSSQEARDLIRDIVEAAFDAGEDNM